MTELTEQQEVDKETANLKHRGWRDEITDEERGVLLARGWVEHDNGDWSTPNDTPHLPTSSSRRRPIAAAIKWVEKHIWMRKKAGRDPKEK